MICDYYEKLPDLVVKIFMDGECDKEEEDNICGGGDENVDSSDDSSDEEDQSFELWGMFAQLKLNNYFSLHLYRWFEACH